MMIFLCLFVALTMAKNYDPVVILHGMGDTCSNPAFKQIGTMIKENLNEDTYVTCIESGPLTDGILKSMTN